VDPPSLLPHVLSQWQTIAPPYTTVVHAACYVLRTYTLARNTAAGPQCSQITNLSV
jgi:hypothetical protein